MFIFAVQLTIMFMARYVIIPALTVLVYTFAIPGLGLLGIAYKLGTGYDRLADWIEKQGYARPNGFPNLPW